MNNRYITLCFCMLLASCSPKKIDHEFKKLQVETRNVIDAHIVRNTQERAALDAKYNVKELLEQGITQDDAVRIALLNNSRLPVLFKDLGIAKADLVQAQLFTNPYLETVFDTPISSDYFQRTRIDVQLTFKLSDLWIVPLKKKVAQDELEITVREILKEIIATAAEAKKGYNECVYALAQRDVTMRILFEVRELRDQIYHRYNFGYHTDLDTNLADTMVGHWEIELIHVQQRVATAFLHLRNTMGLSITTELIKLMQDPFHVVTVPSCTEIEEMLPTYQPELRIIEMKIQQARHQKHLEKAQVLGDVSLGFTHIKDLEEQVGRGPLFELSLPFFDWNQAQIAKAGHLTEKFTKLYHNVMRNVKKDLRTLYTALDAAKQKICAYHTIMPSYQKAIEFTTTYSQTMQVNMLLVIESRIKYYEAQTMMLMAYHEQANAIVEIEQLLGKEIDGTLRTDLQLKS